MSDKLDKTTEAIYSNTGKLNNQQVVDAVTNYYALKFGVTVQVSPEFSATKDGGLQVNYNFAGGGA